MQKRKGLVDQKFNRLLCLQYIKSDKRGNARYLWKCDCGQEKEIDGSKVKRGYTKSCGCLAKEVSSAKPNQYRLEYREAHFNAYYHQYLKAAEKRKYQFNLTKDDFRQITQQKCHCCQADPVPIVQRSKKHYGQYIGNGIDRVINSIGYTKENCVPCCKMCNKMKQHYDKNHFLEKVRSIYECIFLDR
jgi:hypothetical protein